MSAVRQAKGSTIHTTLAFLRHQGGEEAVQRVLARVPAGEAAAIRGAHPTEEIPIERLYALWEAVDAVLGDGDPGWPERSGAFAIEGIGVQLYGGILLKKSPLEFLTQRVSLFRLYYQPGDMEVVDMEDGRAVLRLVGFDPGNRVFCRRQTGGLLRSVELAGGGGASVRHVRCSVEGDAFCEWELRWS